MYVCLYVCVWARIDITDTQILFIIIYMKGLYREFLDPLLLLNTKRRDGERNTHTHTLSFSLSLSHTHTHTRAKDLVFGVDLLELKGCAAAHSFRLGLRPFSHLLLVPRTGHSAAAVDSEKFCMWPRSTICVFVPALSPLSLSLTVSLSVSYLTRIVILLPPPGLRHCASWHPLHSCPHFHLSPAPDPRIDYCFSNHELPKKSAVLLQWPALRYGEARRERDGRK